MSALDAADTVFEEWRLRADHGKPPDPESVIRAHPEIEGELRLRFEAVQMLDSEFAQGRMHRPPARVGAYRIVRELGRGGMGVVYEAVQETMDRRVALKVLFPSVVPAGHAVGRFRQEARIAGSLKHTNIVAVHDLGQEEGLWYCAMELVDGPPLSRVIEQIASHAGGARAEKRCSGTPSTLTGEASGGSSHFRRVARMFAEVADALGVAHEAGVLHRDVKPSNLLLDRDGHLRLVDFGLARLEADGARLTRTGEVVGTPLYMSPEHFRGRGVGPRSDVYSLGATLYEVLTLRPPHDPKDTTRLAAEVVSRDPPRPCSVEPRVPRDLETVVLKAIEKEPSRRYATAAAFADDLRAFAVGDGICARRIGPAGRLWRSAKRHRVRSVLVLAVLLLGGLAGRLAWQAAAQEEERREVEYGRLLDEATDRSEIWGSDYTTDGSFLVSREQGQSLEELLRRAILIAPARPEAWARLASIVEPSEAICVLNEAGTRGLSPTEYHWTKARLLWAAGRRAEASDQMAVARCLPGGTQGAGPWLPAAAYLKAGDRKEAIALATSSLAGLKPGQPVDHRVLLQIRATAREGEGDIAGAIEDLASLRTLVVKGIERLSVRIASLWRRLGNTTRAESEFERALGQVRAAGTSDAWFYLCMGCVEAREMGWLDQTLSQTPPEHAEAGGIHYYRGRLQMQRGALSEALRSYDAALAAGFNEAAVQSVRRQVFLWKKDYPAALEAVRRLEVLRPPGFDIQELNGLALISMGRLAEAVEAFREYVERHPGDHSGHHELGVALASQGHWQEALAPFERAVEIDPLCGDCRSMQITALQMTGKLKEALLAADGALSVFPRRSNLYTAKARVLCQTGQLDLALEAVGRAIEIDPKSEDEYFLRGSIFKLLGRLEDQLADLQRAIDCAPDHEARRIDHALVLRDLDRVPEALAEAEAGCARSPREALWQTVRGELLAMVGRFDEALAAMDHAVEIDPLSAAQQFWRGTALMMHGRYQDALDVLNVLDLDDVVRSDQQSQALVGLGRKDEALRVAEGLRTRRPDDLAAAMVVVARYRDLGRDEEARRVAKEATGGPPPAEGLYAFFYLAAVAGRTELARSLLPTLDNPIGMFGDYNRACWYALVGDRDLAVDSLERAAAAGLRLDPARTDDPDLASLKGNQRFEAVWARLKAP